MLYVALVDQAWQQAELALAFILSAQGHGKPGGTGSVLGELCPLGYNEQEEEGPCVKLVQTQVFIFYMQHSS